MSFDETLWQEFAAESEEHIDAIERRLGAGPVLDRPGVDALFRAFHSLKGMTDALGATGMKALAHRCEDLLGAARASRVSVIGPVADALLAAVDALRVQRAAMLEARQDLPADGALLGRLGALADGEAEPAATAPDAVLRDTGAALLGSLASRLAEAAPRLARLRSRDAEVEAEARELAAAARMLALPRLAVTLETLAAGGAPLATFGRLRRQLGVLAARSGEEAGALALAAALRASGAEAIGPALATLSLQLEAIVAGAASDAEASRAAARDAAALAAALGLDAAEAQLLAIEDLVDRAAEPEAAEILARQGPALAERLRAAAEGGIAAAEALGDTTERRAPDPTLPAQVPAEFAEVLGPEGRRRLQAALGEGLPLYRARIAIGAPPEQEAKLEAWLREHTTPLTSRTLLDATPPCLDMLLAAATPLPELMRRMESIDPAHRLVLSLAPLDAPTAQHAAPVTMRVRQDTVDGIIALEAEARAAALAVSEALNDEAALEALAALGRLERRLTGPAAREIAAAHDDLRRLVERMNSAENRLALALRQLDEAVLGLRVVPIGTLFARLPRVVRAVAEAGGKDVDVLVEGQDVQIDRSLVELLADPLLHLVRNAVDHGVEAPAQRAAAGKPRRATLVVRASRRLSQIRVTVQDDGRGIDRDAVLAKAVERGLVGAEAAARMSDAEAHALLFAPGFSTAETITETSGRGVGLDVVQEAARRAGGALELTSEPGRGTTFTILVPVTAAVQTVLLVDVGTHPYALPAARVEAVLDGAAEPGCAVLPLAPILGLGDTQAGQGGLVVVRSGGRRVALQVDRVRRQANLLLRPLHPSFAGLPAVAGVGVLGNGDPVVVLEPDGLAGS